jgi:serine/threonine protein kinase
MILESLRCCKVWLFSSFVAPHLKPSSLSLCKAVGTLSHLLWLHADRCAPAHDVDQWIVEICRGLVELHGEGIVLHDLKPSNVLLDDFGGVVLADFGIARISEQTISSSVRSRTSIEGTAPYM